MDLIVGGPLAPVVPCPVQSGGPTRNPIHAVGRENFRAKFHSLKNGRFLKCESLLEHRAMKLFEMAPGVTDFTEQPKPLSIKMGSCARRRRYTPDLRVTWNAGAPWLVEVKPSEYANSPFWREKLKAAALAAAVTGFHLVVITELHLAAVGMPEVDRALALKHRKHVEYLGEHRARSTEYDDGPVERKVLRVLAEALEESPSLGALKALGLASSRSCKEACWPEFVSACAPRRLPRKPAKPVEVTP